MQLGDAIVLAAIILALAGVIITVTILIKKKTVSITLFTLFAITIALIVIFKQDLVKVFNKTNIASSLKIDPPQYVWKVRFKNLDPYKLNLSDVLFYWGKPTAISKDSSLLIYYSKYDDQFYNFKTEKWIKANEIFLNNTNLIKINDFPRNFKVNDVNTIILKNKKLLFIGINGGNVDGFLKHLVNKSAIWRDVNNTPAYYSVKQIENIFGKPTKLWISEGDQIRIIQIYDGFFFFENGNCTALGMSTEKDFDPSQVEVFIHGLTFRQEKL